ncbi:MAG TPA: PHP domain-containing protein [Methanotrichaceae archaeon]|nr:PHP domain-containing protein [Methanotrichaceae archaeon]
MRFDLHVHSNYSDGHDDVKTILKAARKRGLDGIAITDHDSLGGSRAARRIIKDLKLKIILIPGAEVTTADGHLLVLGVEDIPKRGLTPEETTEIAHDLGGITIVPHPYHPFRHAIGRIPDCDAVEVYNSKHLFGIANARARLGAKKRKLPMVAGSDSHFAATVGLGVTRIDAEDDRGAVEAIRSGRTRIEGRRTPPRFFIGNTFQAIYLEMRKGVRRI